jgi:acyl-coenzyme A thioesterase PaaI-like protein
MTDVVAQLNAGLAQLVPRAHEMGVRFVAADPGTVRAALPVEGNGNHFGTIYAGVIFTLAEVLGGALHFATFDATTHYPLVRSMSIDFVAAGRTPLTARATLDADDVARVRAEAADGGKPRFELRATVSDESGTVVATTVGDYQLRPYGS